MIAHDQNVTHNFVPLEVNSKIIKLILVHVGHLSLRWATCGCSTVLISLIVSQKISLIF